MPIARWRGFGGQTHVREWSFETFTWAAGLAGATSNIALFMTVHVPLVHPLQAAKALATVDHISGGRAGLNIVCGWNPDEFAMFGQTVGERTYDQAEEWITIIERAYGAAEPFDFDGAFYRLKGVVSRPASLQVPRPVTMNAAFGAPGRNFAARHCDYLFSTFSEIADGRAHVTDIQARASQVGRNVGVYTVCHVVCRETQAEAEDYYRHYAWIWPTTARSTSTCARKRNSRIRTTRRRSPNIASALPAGPEPIRWSARRSGSSTSLSKSWTRATPAPR